MVVTSWTISDILDAGLDLLFMFGLVSINANNLTNLGCTLH